MPRTVRLATLDLPTPAGDARLHVLAVIRADHDGERTAGRARAQGFENPSRLQVGEGDGVVPPE